MFLSVIEYQRHKSYLFLRVLLAWTPTTSWWSTALRRREEHWVDRSLHERLHMSLEVFASSLIKDVGDTSGKHADKILCRRDSKERTNLTLYLLSLGDVESGSGFQHTANPVGVCRT